MENITLVYIFVIFFLLIFIIWLIWGGKKHQFVGIAPLLEHDGEILSYRDRTVLNSVCSSSKFERSMSFRQLSEVQRKNNEIQELLEADPVKLKEICAKKPKVHTGSKGEMQAKKY